ncbi:hypothetical protein AB0K89_10765 [Streptomyces cinnamoneus]|uniref:hypothetical protein n=1 Tax=Streptomyces cinnamoneus TaxID=53446 RepID=UPI003431A1EE
MDGIGHSPLITKRAALLAEVGARIAATRGPFHGLLTAAELISHPGPEDCLEEDAVAVAAVAHLDRAEFSIAWTGDCAAWSYDPTTGSLTRLTTDHTMGQFLRQVHPGGPTVRAEHHDDWVRVSLARSSVATVRETETTAPLVVLASDGIQTSRSAPPASPPSSVRSLMPDRSGSPMACCRAPSCAPPTSWAKPTMPLWSSWPCPHRTKCGGRTTVSQGVQGSA